MRTSRSRSALVIVLTLLATSPALGDWDEGVAAFNAGRYQDAVAQFRTVVEQSPDAPAGYYMLGLALLRQKQPAQAVESLGKAVELGPDDPRYRLTYAQAQLQAGRPDGALATLASLDPKSVPEAHRQAFGQLLAKAATESSNTDAALRALDRLAATNGSSKTVSSSKTLWLAVAHVAQKANRSDKAFSALATAYGLDKKDEELGRRAVHTAFAAAQKAQDGARQAWYAKATDMAARWAAGSKSSEAYLMAGQAQIGVKDYSGARGWFEKAAAAAPGDPQPHYEQARCALALKEPRAALQSLAAASERSPDTDLTRQIHLAEGFAYRHLEDFVKAGDAFRKAGDDAKAAEMADLQERKKGNELFEKERAECKRKVAEVEKLKVEMSDLKGTDAWEQLEADAQAITAACAAHLKDG